MTTTAEDRRGLLVPVANPEGVAPLIAIALAACEPDDPPLRVLGLVHRGGGGSRSERPEPEHEATPPTPALSAAIDYAQAHGAIIDARAVWSDNPASDIITIAQTARVAWVLLGYHRTQSGSDTMGGVVRDVFAKAKALAINVGVFIQGTDRPFGRVFAAVDAGPDGHAALALAVRIALRSRSKLRALLVSGLAARAEDDLSDMVKGARLRLGRLFHSDVLSKRSLDQLFRQAPGRLLIVGRKFAEEVGLPLDEVPGGDRCVIVVHGGRAK